MIVALGSQSKLKIDAVSQSLDKLSDLVYTLQSYSVDSGVNVQPIGWTEIYQGVSNRLQGLRSQDWCGADILIAIESGLVEEEGHWFDIAIVMAQARGQEIHTAISAGLEVLPVLIEPVRKEAGKITWGEVLSRLGKEVKSWDPHMFLTKRATSRLDMLIPAIRSAVAQVMLGFRRAA